MNTNEQLKTEFGERAVVLIDGSTGLRGGLRCEATVPKDISADDPVMDFIATDETVDRYNEVIRLDGWQLDNYRANPVVVDSHDYSSITRILGNSPDVKITDGKMINRVRFALDNPLGAMAYKMAKGGFIKSQSVGFIPIEWTRGKGATEPDRIYTKQELLEISLVSIPANPGATIGAALKSGAIERGDVRAVFEALKQFCNEQETPLRDARATAAGSDLAQLLPQLRSLEEVIRKL